MLGSRNLINLGFEVMHSHKSSCCMCSIGCVWRLHFAYGIDFGGDAPGAYLPVAVVQLHFTSPQSQLLFGSRISAGQSHQC
ncbi:hypothetical protein D9H21_09255 [Escherichia coli]|nr:hypothetical protein [Escherichia coli]